MVLGGLHAHSCPDEVALHADAVAIGEGTATWPRILGDFERGELRPTYHGAFDGSYAAEPAPRRALLDRQGYLTTASVIATRGCHNRCGFCYLSTEDLRMPLQDAGARAGGRRASGRRTNPTPCSSTTTSARGPSICAPCGAALRPLGIIWSAAVTIDVTDDPSLVRDMALSGCTGVFIGFESLHDGNLADARKKTPPAEDYARRVRVLHDHGVQVNGSFVLGFDHDRRDVFESTVQWIEDVRLECGTFHLLTPYPGTPLFRQLESEGRILHRDWNLYDTAHAVFRPRHMTPAELEEGYASCYRRLFSHRSIWRRRPEQFDAVLPYLAMSYLYKRSNAFWHLLIRNDWTARVWRPIVQASRRRHLRYRERLAREGTAVSPAAPAPAGV